MAEQSSDDPTYVFTNNAISRAVVELTRSATHEHVPGYLAIMRAQADGSGLPGRSSDITELYDRYLRVADSTEKHPYIRPFISRGKGLKLSNRNVAGSYAVSNRRAGGPYFRVVDVTGEKQNTEYRLNADHAKLAMAHLLQGNRLPIAAATAFFYRDYGFQLETPTVSAVIELFRTEFGLCADKPDQAAAFDTIFYDDASIISDSDLVKLIDIENE